LPDTYHSARSGRGTATLNFYGDRDIVDRRAERCGCARTLGLCTDSGRPPPRGQAAAVPVRPAARPGHHHTVHCVRRRGVLARAARVRDRRHHHERGVGD